MLGRLFGRGKKDEDRIATEHEAFDRAKEEALQRVLGPMDEMVYHAIIPFFLGGGLDLYTFSQCIPGVVFATQELIGRERKDRPRKSRIGHCELVACLPPGRPRDDKDGLSLVNSLLNPVARYAFHATLNPGEPAEIPVGDADATQAVLFDAFDPKGVPFEVLGERFGLLLVMPLHPAELVFARSQGSAALVQKLKAARSWPYADLERAAVV